MTGCEGAHHLQEVSSHAEETSETSSRANNSLVGCAGEGCLGGGGWGAGANYRCGGGCDNSGVNVGRGGGRAVGKQLAYLLLGLSLEQYRVPGAAVHYGCDSWLVADGARAVGDGDSLRL